MIILITGASHTGKTLLAQKLLEKYSYPYLSIDHLKMGLIRSGYADLSLDDDDKITEYMWPIVREMIKTAVENRQDLLVEGCYIPFDWAHDFEEDYLKDIQCFCLVMTDRYIEESFDSIKKYARVIEDRIDDDWCTKESLLSENKKFLLGAKKWNLNTILIDKNYDVDLVL